MGAAHDYPILRRGWDLLMPDGSSFALHHIANVDLIGQNPGDSHCLPHAAPHQVFMLD